MKAYRPINMETEVWQAVEEISKRKEISLSKVIEKIITLDEEIQKILKKNKKEK